MIASPWPLVAIASGLFVTSAPATMAGTGTGSNDTSAPATRIAQTRTRRVATKPTPPPPSGSAPISEDAWRTAINGVYVGTYGTNPDDNVTAKLYVKFAEDGSVLGTVTGVFTFDVPPGPGAKPVTYTYTLIGRPQGRGAGFYSAKPVGQSAPEAYAFKELWVQFVRSIVQGANGQMESVYDRDQLSGWVLDHRGRRTSTLAAARDKAASDGVDRLMAAEVSAASRTSETASTPPPRPAPAPTASAGSSSATRKPALNTPTASAQIDDVMSSIRGSWTSSAALPARPSLQGVFNGTYTRENEPPTRFKLTITHAGDDASGMAAGTATIYLPTGSGTKAYTYSLVGHYSPHDFELKASDWETIPPKDFKNFRGMGFRGEFRSNQTQNTARIVSVKPAYASDLLFFLPTFEAAWDPTESADIKGTLAAQKAVGDADQVAALKEHAELVRNAQPAQLASKNIVRKSPAYWSGYPGDFLREVFDGGFADDVDRDPVFQVLFTEYVDLFAEKCHDYLPARYTAVTITTTSTSRNGYVSTSSRTVEMDSRFVDKYVEFSGVPPNPGTEEAKEATAKTFAIAGRILHAGGPSHGTSPADANAILHLMAAHGLAGGGGMDKFFATEVRASGPSAALRQMGENLLRGAMGQPSLQEAGAGIAGAEAETDPNLPPGRFTHLIDAAHAFYREPAHARLASRFETAFDETLAAKYRGVMTPEEEYYYANDFEHRFRDQIMQPRSYNKDPAWPRLHPAVEECVEEIH